MTLALAFLLCAVLPSQSPDSLPARAVAVTFDDLPLVSAVELTGAGRQQLTDRLLTAITRYRVPAIGFVNENKLLEAGVIDTARVALLRSWLSRGLELGNHTWSHPDLHRVSLTRFQDDVLRGEHALSRSATVSPVSFSTTDIPSPR
jgi:peptidoglycan/xylan/chitin deacetylase (PgdA/CDA1 family)